MKQAEFIVSQKRKDIISYFPSSLSNARWLMYWKKFLLPALAPSAAGKSDACSAPWQLFHLAIVSSHWLAEQKKVRPVAAAFYSTRDTDQRWRGCARDTSRRRPAAEAGSATAAPASHSFECQTRLRRALPCSTLPGCLKCKYQVTNKDGGCNYF